VRPARVVFTLNTPRHPFTRKEQFALFAGEELQVLLEASAGWLKTGQAQVGAVGNQVSAAFEARQFSLRLLRRTFAAELDGSELTGAQVGVCQTDPPVIGDQSAR
jgi:hypothetical protein